MKKKQYGIAQLETVLIAIVVIVIAATGWYVWKINDSGNKSLDSANKVVQGSMSNDCQGDNLSRACIEKANATSTTFYKLPSALQTVALSEISKQVPACVKDGKLVDSEGKNTDPPVQYAPVGSAIIVIGCDGGSAGLFAKDVKEQKWVFIEKTQMAFSCKNVIDYFVPKKLLEISAGPARCINDQGQMQSYDEAYSKAFF